MWSVFKYILKDKIRSLNRLEMRCERKCQRRYHIFWPEKLRGGSLRIKQIWGSGRSARSSVSDVLEKPLRYPRTDLSKQFEFLNLESRKKSSSKDCI